MIKAIKAIKAINSEQRRAGQINYTSVKFKYNRGKIPPLRIDGKFRLLTFKNSRRHIYSLSIKCNEAKEPFFERLCEVVSRESCRLVPKVNGKKLKPEDFKLVKNSKVKRLFMQRSMREILGKPNVKYPSNCLRIRS